LHAKQANIAYLLCNIGIISARFSIKWGNYSGIHRKPRHSREGGNLGRQSDCF